MTNKIYLSFNRLYTLKDGDYHGATLTYRIKHGDDLLAEGEIKGKSFSQFIRPIDIEEMEITKPLSVEYICIGNVEDVSVSLTPAADGPFHVSDGYIKDATIREGWLSDCKKRFAGSEPLPFGGFPAAISIAVEADGELSKEDQLKKLVNEIVDVQIKKGLQPGGLLYRR